LITRLRLHLEPQALAAIRIPGKMRSAASVCGSGRKFGSAFSDTAENAILVEKLSEFQAPGEFRYLNPNPFDIKSAEMADAFLITSELE
jgi:hypothetical protein